MAKGIIDIYDEICRILSATVYDTEFPFIDWIFDTQINFYPGMFCNTVAWYVKKDRWYLEEAHYESFQEESSTWYARKYNKHYPPDNPTSVMKYFNLEKDERLITTNGKERPVILLSYANDDWWNPSNSSRHEKYWLCIPIFSYKDRHPQNYVLNDQRLNNPYSFYIPSRHNNNPGLYAESSARYQAIQMVKEEHLSPLKWMCEIKEPKMQRPFALTKIGLELMLYHFYNQFSLFNELEESKTLYTLFKEGVNKRIDVVWVSNP
jgi:hypothetical protein